MNERLKPCKSPYCECDVGKCTHPGFYDCRGIEMNERIQKLADQAQQYAEYNTPQGLEWFPMFKERFAELIVRECVDICQQATEQNNQTYAMLKEDELAEKMVIHGSIKQAEKLAQGIKQHFGVEE